MEKKIKFGTGGLRGIMGNDVGYINHHVIRHVTHGLAKNILSSDAPKSVGVAYDTRFNSVEFAQIVCDVLSGFDIKTYIFDKPMPTPALSHAIRIMNLGWGVCITASHNPQEYNGYKVYDKNGVQVTDRIAKEIIDSVNSVDIYDIVPEKKPNNINKFDEVVIKTYFEQIISFVQPENKPSDYPFIYSALHGTGANAIPAVIERLGFNPILIQQNPDGAFGGLKTPNPEEPVVYEKALNKAEETNAELILATDPDCDRVGVMVKSNGNFVSLNGNQIGALLIDYLAQTKKEKLGIETSKKGTVISTIVSGLLGEFVAKNHGLNFVRLLTGFKYIGEYIVNMPENENFFFGYEESFGFLAGTGAKDKDAVIATALIVKMAAFYKTKGKTLSDRLSELNEKYGYCLESLHNINVSQEKQREIMDRFRSDASIDGVTRSEDYLYGIKGLPPADVLMLYFTGDSETLYNTAWVAIRPSGTEPKLKIYTGVHSNTYEAAQTALEDISNKILDFIQE